MKSIKKYVPLTLLLVSLGLGSSPECIAKQKPANEQIIKESGGEYFTIKYAEDIPKEKKKQTGRENIDSILEELNITKLTKDELSRWPHAEGITGYTGEFESLRISIFLNEHTNFYHLRIEDSEENYNISIFDNQNDGRADKVILNNRVFERKNGTYNYLGTEEQIEDLLEQFFKYRKKGFTEEQIKDMLENYLEQQNTKNPYTKEQLKTVFKDADRKLKFTKKLIKEINLEREELYN